MPKHNDMGNFNRVVDGLGIQIDQQIEKVPFGGKTPEQFYEERPQTFRDGISGNPMGKKVGTKSRRTVRQIAEDMNFDPIEAAIMLIREDPKIKKRFKVRDGVPIAVKKDLLKFVGDKMYASLKSVDMAITDGTNDNKPRTVQLYLPEKGSTEKKSKGSAASQRIKEKAIEHVAGSYLDDDDDGREPVRVELTVDLGRSIQSGDPVGGVGK